MPNTITTFNVFSTGVVFASEVNENFSNFRGDQIPIEEDTAAASDDAHDLGTLSHTWNTAYVNSIIMSGSTSTTDVTIQPRTDLTAGGLEILWGGNTIGTFLSDGLKRESLGRMTSAAGNPGLGGFAYGDTSATFDITSTTLETTIGTLRIAANSTGVIECGFTAQQSSGGVTAASYLEMTGSGKGVRLYVKYGLTSTAVTAGGSMEWRRGTAAAAVVHHPSSFRWFVVNDVGYAPDLYIEFGFGYLAADTVMRLENVRLYAKEL